MSEMTERKYPEDYYQVAFSFTNALKRYVQFQNQYHQLVKENQRYFDPNIIPLELFGRIVEEVCGEPVSYEAVLHQALRYATPNSKMVEMVGIYICKSCKSYDLIPIEVKTNRDHLVLMKNGLFDLEAHREYENTEEQITLNLMIPDHIAPDCQCPGKRTDKNELNLENVHFGIKLSNETVENLLGISSRKK